MEVLLGAGPHLFSDYCHLSFVVDLPFISSVLFQSGPGSQIAITIHSCDKAVLLDFIEAARLEYKEAAISRVNVHVTDGYANWGRVVPKTRRSFSTLILPDGIKETLLADIQEFLDNEKW